MDPFETIDDVNEIETRLVTALQELADDAGMADVSNEIYNVYRLTAMARRCIVMAPREN